MAGRRVHRGDFPTLRDWTIPGARDTMAAQDVVGPARRTPIDSHRRSGKVRDMHGASTHWRTWSLGLALALAGLAPPTSARAQDEKDQPATVKAAPREGSWMKQHESFLERAKEGKIDLLFLGDSITRGWDSKEKSGEGPREV